MSSVQFDPKITPDFQIDWRRRSSQGADPFTDFLQQHFDGERTRAPKKREEAADPLSGRKPHVVVAHARTLRGEAKRVDDTEHCLADQSGKPEAGAKEAAPLPLEDDAAANTGTADQDPAPAETETDAAPEQSAAVADTAAAAVAVAPAVVAVQSTDQAGADLVMTPLVEPTTEGEALPGLAGEAETPSSGAETATDDKTEQQAAAAMAEAGLAEDVAALVTGQAPTPDAAAAIAAVAETPILPVVQAKPEQPLLQVSQAPAFEPTPAAQPRPERSPTEIKLRPSAAPRPAAAQAAPAAAATPTAQPIQPHAATPLPAAPLGEFTSTGDPFDPALSDGSGQGWAMHLAQGAASRRPDFVAQLRQHLQNLPAHEQVAIHLQRAMREGTNKFSIQLSPAELGNIHVKLEIDEEKRVTAAVTVERPSTLELLQRDTKGLERALHNAGLNMEGGDLSFSLGRGDQDFAQDLRQSGASAAGGAGLDGESEVGQPVDPVAQVLDTAAGVVNLQV